MALYQTPTEGYVRLVVMTTFEPLDIAGERCKGCALCVHACPKHCLELDQTIVNGLGYHPVKLIDAAACTSCVICARVCPDAVFTVYAPAKAATR